LCGFGATPNPCIHTRGPDVKLDDILSNIAGDDKVMNELIQLREAQRANATVHKVSEITDFKEMEKKKREEGLQKQRDAKKPEIAIAKKDDKLVFTKEPVKRKKMTNWSLLKNLLI
jgi:hypothetical protein